jgi:hypothetical protein
VDTVHVTDRYYVYVYIDPRNLEEFYYGKGTGSRSHAHLHDEGDSVKVARIKAIQKEGLEPTIRIIARGLTSAEALMVETALIWKLGRTLTNVASGQYVGRFRPPDTFHKRLARFDFENGIYYVNVGEGETRNWADCRRFGFLAAGGHPKWSDAIRGLEVGDVVVAYLKGAGYVGVGVVRSSATPYATYRNDGRTLAEFELVEPNIGHDSSDLAVCEYIVAVEWMATADRESAKWRPRSGLFTSQLVRASLDAQPATVAFLEEAFGVDLGALADGERI